MTGVRWWREPGREKANLELKNDPKIYYFGGIKLKRSYQSSVVVQKRIQASRIYGRKVSQSGEKNNTATNKQNGSPLGRNSRKKTLLFSDEFSGLFPIIFFSEKKTDGR